MAEATIVEPDPALRQDPADRLDAQAGLDRYRILDTGPEAGFDDVVLLACQVSGTPLALVAFVDGGRDWFKATVGLASSEMPLDRSLGRHALAQPGLLVIPDLAADPRTRDDALVTGEPALRFYAGARLETPEGLVVGTLSVMDPKARPAGLTPAQASGLLALARQVMTLMELRLAATSRDEALRAARDGDVRRRRILESATDYAIVAMDRAGTVTEWNAGAQAVFGWSAAEMVGDTAERFFTPEDRAEDRAVHEMRRALEAGRADDARWHLRRDGTRFWAHGEMMPLRGDGGEHMGFLKIVRDETEGRAAAERQRADQEFMRSVLASSNDCIKVLDLEANLVFMSEGGRRVMEVSDFNAIRGCHWPDFWQGDLAAAARAAVAAAKAGRLGHFQGPADTVAGTPKYWDVRVTPILDADGRPEKLLSISRDITEGRRAEGALREAQGLNTLILNSASDCIVLLDLEGHTQFVSPGGIEAMEIADVGAIIGLSWLRVWTGADAVAARSAVAEARAGGTGHFQGFCATHKGRPKWWDVAISPVRDSDGRPERLVSVGRDITGRKQAEARRLALLDLGDRLRDLQDPAEMAVVAAGIMGAALGADRAGYGTVDEAAETLAIERDWTASGADGIAGTYRFRDFGSFVDDLRQGSIVAIADIRQDARTGSHADALEALGVRSILNVPLFEHGRFVALFYVNGAGARGWGPEQVAFVRNAADRARAAIERRRAEI